MSFTWTEIKKWAKERGLEPKKSGSEFFFENKTFQDLNSLVTCLFNKITNDKWVEYQKNHKPESEI